jgi:hypothetical protein
MTCSPMQFLVQKSSHPHSLCISSISISLTCHLVYLNILTAAPPQSIVNLGTLITQTKSTGIRIATISYSPEYHWASLLIDICAGTIAWGDSLQCPIPDGFEKCLRTWLAIFVPEKQFLPLQTLSSGRQTDGYSCRVAAVNTLRHHIFGDKLWSTSQRKVLRIQEFINILEFSQGWRTCVSILHLHLLPHLTEVIDGDATRNNIICNFLAAPFDNTSSSQGLRIHRRGIGRCITT